MPAADAASFVAERLSSTPATHHVDVVVAALLHDVERTLGPWGTATEVEPGVTRINMDVDDLSWIVLMLTAINAGIHHAEPPELVILLHTLGSRFAVVRSGQ